MERKGAFDIWEMNPITVEFMLYILLRGLLSCNQPDICDLEKCLIHQCGLNVNKRRFTL